MELVSLVNELIVGEFTSLLYILISFINSYEDKLAFCLIKLFHDIA
jgi:uncharacterized membrane protein YczE